MIILEQNICECNKIICTFRCWHQLKQHWFKHTRFAGIHTYESPHVQALEDTTKAIISSLFFGVEDPILRSVQRVTEIVTCCATRLWPASCCFASKLVPGRKVGRSWGRNAGACHVSRMGTSGFFVNVLRSLGDERWFWLQILDTS